MHLRPVSVLVLTISLVSAAFGWVAIAQETPGTPAGQAPEGGQRGGRGWGRGMGMGSGVMGTVTEVAGDHLTIKNYSGETWTVHFSANTRIMKQPPRAAREQGQAQDQNQGQERRMQGYAPEPITASEIKVGDAIMAGGEIDRDAKSVGAVGIMLVDPERAKQMREMQANYGKTWLAGRVTSISETKVTIEGGMDNSPHTFVADENTSFRRRREPITLGDMQVGDNVRVEGAVKDGQFVATTVNVMMPPANSGPARRQGPPPQ
jgi:preprotein translocase subunit YajC